MKEEEKENRYIHIFKMNFLWKILLLFSIIYSCHASYKFQQEKDIVNSTDRYRINFFYRFCDKNTPVSILDQTIIKEVSEKDTTYNIFDVLILSSKSFRVDNKAYIIIDDDVFQMDIDHIEFENIKNIEEKKEDIATSDTTSISVVTGYSESNKKISRFNYTLPKHLISKMQNAEKIVFRYYSGPDMLSFDLIRNDLKKFKFLIK